MDIITGALGETRAIDISIRTGMPGPPGPPGADSTVPGPPGPPGDAAQATTIVGAFGHLRGVTDLPRDGFLPADWDGPGRPASDTQVQIGTALVFQPLIVDPLDQNLFVYLGFDWVSIGTITGERGEKGDPGERGERGEQGLRGDVGERGDTGLPGERGERGDTGPRGDIGLQGERGERGDVGERGEQGERGLQGERGDTGEVGPPSFPDASLVGGPYGRLRGEWSPVLSTGGGTIQGDVTVVGFTLLTGDTRAMGEVTLDRDPTLPGHAVTKRYTDAHVPDLSAYARLDGAQMEGPLWLASDPVEPLEAATKRFAESLVPDVSPFLRRDGGAMSGVLLLRGDPTIDDEASTKRYIDTRVAAIPPPPDLSPYLRKDGGQMTGSLITQAGGSNTNLGLSVGDNSTGLWRSSGYLIAVISGQTAWQTSSTEMLLGVRLNAATQLITNVGAPTSAGDAANRNYVDQRRAPPNVFTLPNDIGPITAPTFINLAPVIFQIPRGGNSRILVNINLNCTTPGESQIVLAGARIDQDPTQERYAMLYRAGNVCGGIYAQFILDVTGVNLPAMNVQVACSGGATATGFSVLAGSQITTIDLGPR